MDGHCDRARWTDRKSSSTKRRRISVSRVETVWLALPVACLAAEIGLTIPRSPVLRAGRAFRERGIRVQWVLTDNGGAYRSRPFHKACCWRSDLRNVLEGYRYFERKWGIDITEYGTFKNFLMNYNKQIGWLRRRVQTERTLSADRMLKRIAWRVEGFGRLWERFLFRQRAKRPGYYEWPDYSK